MEGFGHDVAQKIKSAIRAKLVELDAYVDDELPDYIMVMVANKKSKASMSEDLNLFLNEHTEHFTDWLHEVLNKLHSVTLEGSKGRRCLSGSTSETRKSHFSGNDKHPPAEHETVTTSETSPVEVMSVAEESLTDPTDSTAMPTTMDAPPSDQDEFLAIKAEQEKDDILGEELQDEPAIISAVIAAASPAVQPKPETKIQPIKAELVVMRPPAATSQGREQQRWLVKTAIPSDVPRIIRTRVATADTPESALNDATTSNGVTVSKLSTKLTAVSVYDMDSHSVPSRKRKAPTSTLGAIVQRPFPRPDDEEDEYDPRHPIIGAVASVVQVTQRRSSIPPERQANKSLLFKALEEARKSVLSSTKPSHDIYVNNDSATQLFTRTYLSTIDQHGDDSGSRILRRVSKPASTFSTDLRVPRFSLPISRQTKMETKSPPKMPSPIIKLSAAATRSSAVTYEPMHIDQQDADVTAMKVEIEKPEEIEELADYSSGKEDEPPMECPVLQQNASPARSASPKFIITLDGVDADEMFPGYENSAVDALDETLDLLVEDEFELEFQDQHENHDNNSVDDEPFVSHGDETDASEQLVDAEEMERVGAKRPRLIQERCRYWPSCRNGDSCMYRHPSTPCITFPNCKFGNRCVYLHPACKFDSTCSRRDCPYAHTSRIVPSDAPIVSSSVLHPRRQTFAKVTLKRLPTPTLLASKTRCRNFPKCSNMDCPFLHHKPCRYGVSCSRKDCIFSHPSLPKRDQLRWSNQSPSGDQSTSHISEREFAVVKVGKHVATPVAS